MRTILINGKKYNLKYTLRAFFIFENITGYPFAFGKTINEYLLFYAMLIANNETFDMSFDKFIDLCDEDVTLFNQFKNFILSEIKKQSQDILDEDVKKKTQKPKNS